MFVCLLSSSAVLSLRRGESLRSPPRLFHALYPFIVDSELQFTWSFLERENTQIRIVSDAGQE
jgi:hypothetical protein